MNLSVFDKAGIKITQQGTVKDIFKNSSLDWEVKQKRVYTQIDGTNPAQHLGTLCYNPLSGYVVNYRSDNNTVLGMVHPKTYKIVQNVDAFNFIDKLPNFTFEKVGTFNNGKKVFVVGKADEQIEIDTGDFVNFYLTFLHGHDGKSGIKFIICPVRLFCMNQFNLMLETATFKYNIAHTGDVNVKLKLIQDAIAKSKNYVNGLQEEIKNLMNTKSVLTIEQFTDKLIEVKEDDSKLSVTRKQDAKDSIIKLYKDKDDLQNYKGTVFGMLSAVSDYISHLNPIRKSTDINNTFIKNIEGNQLLNRAHLLLAA